MRGRIFLLLQMLAMLLFAAGIPLAARYADRTSAVRAMGMATAGIFVFGLCLAPLFVAGNLAQVGLMLAAGLFLLGLTYGPCGNLLAQLYPVQLRYTGASLSFNLAGVLGAAPAPYVATWRVARFGLWAVGGYLCGGRGHRPGPVGNRRAKPAARPADAVTGQVGDQRNRRLSVRPSQFPSSCSRVNLLRWRLTFSA